MSRIDYSQGRNSRSAAPPANRVPCTPASAVSQQPDADASADPDQFDEPVLQVSASGGAGQRVDRFLVGALAAQVPGLSRTRLQQWFALGEIWSDDRTLLPSTRLAGFETLHVRVLPRDADQAFKPDPVPLSIVYEDADLLVIDKQAGLVVHPAAGHWRQTLLNGLLHHRPALALLPRAGIVHRLDKDTSGLLVVAASERALASLTAQLADRSMSRRYLALASGRIDVAFTVDVPIGRDPKMRTRMAVVEGPTGKQARTHVSPLLEGRLRGAPVTLVECRLETGRTHQIRVHLRHVGHPLVGDSTYGGVIDMLARQALHAWRLGFQHPEGGKPGAWRSDLPADLREGLHRAGIDPTLALNLAGDRA